MTSFTIYAADLVAERRITAAVVKHAQAEAKVQHEHFIARVLIGLGLALFIASVLFTGYVGRRDLREQLVRGCEFTRQQNLDKPAYRDRHCRDVYPAPRFLPFSTSKDPAR